MHLVQMREGQLEVRWTWLPFWMAANPKFKNAVERQLRDAVLLNGVAADEMEPLHRYVVALLHRTFPFEGLDTFLDGMRHIKEG